VTWYSRQHAATVKWQASQSYGRASPYVHAADAVLLAAADAVANRTAELMGEAKSGAVVVELRQVTA
jgi:gamma-glutamyl:cysteine ligase YbdK (ATP-grasp superfamily)